MREAYRRSAGFSLIELMISVAIVGTLATVAIPSFQRVQLRAKASEGRTNLAAIRTAQEGYFVEFGTYLGALPAPAALPGAAKASWPAGSDFELLGWSPTGTVQFQYTVTVPGAGSNLVFTAEAVSDLDGDGTLNAVGYVKAHPTGGASVAGVHCPDTGVWDPTALANTRFDVVGPCDGSSGLSVF